MQNDKNNHMKEIKRGLCIRMRCKVMIAQDMGMMIRVQELDKQVGNEIEFN